MEKVLEREKMSEIQDKIVKDLFGKRMGIKEIKKYLVDAGTPSVRFMKKTKVRANIVDKIGVEYIVEIWVEDKKDDDTYLISMIHTREKDNEGFKVLNKVINESVKEKEIALFGVKMNDEIKNETIKKLTDTELKVFQLLLSKSNKKLSGKDIGLRLNFSVIRGCELKNGIEEKILISTNEFKKHITPFMRKLNKTEKECIDLYEKNNGGLTYKNIAYNFGVTAYDVTQLIKRYKAEKKWIIEKLKIDNSNSYKFGSVKESFSKNDINEVVKYLFDYKMFPYSIINDNKKIYLLSISDNKWVKISYQGENQKVINKNIKFNELEKMLRNEVNKEFVEDILKNMN